MIKTILMSGSTNHLVKIMKEDGFGLYMIETKKDSDEQTWVFLLENPHYDYEARVTLQVNEVDEKDTPIAINVVGIDCRLK